MTGLPQDAKPPSDGPDGDSTDYQSFVSSSADVNAVQTEDGVYRYVSPACERLFGREPGEFEGHPEEDFVHPDDHGALHSGRACLIEVDVATTSFRVRCRDNSYRWTESTARRVKAGDSWLIVSTLRDITARQTQERILQAQAYTDPLTGVANRIVLMDRLNQALRRLSRAAGVLTLLYVDLDRFKVINDSLGHRIGDQILVKMAQRLTRHLRPADTLARLGGDEFVIVAEGMANEQAAVDLAQRIIESGHESFAVKGEQFECTLSIGIASTTDSGCAAADLLREADLALYRAKDRGRNRAEVFNEGLRTSAVSRLETERLVRRAVEEHRLIVEYQPIFNLRDGHMSGVEALLRIDDAGRGLLYPETFLEAAEEAGLLIGMDEWVMAAAVTQATRWIDPPTNNASLEIAINITARHLADVGFAKAAIAHLDEAELPRNILQAEVTERVLMEASNSAMTGLRALRDAGVQVGLDDFGTGYSSLAYLRQFPLDFVKIDRSFIRGMDRGLSERAIVAAIIGVGHALDLTVVAEGVETRSELRALRELGCDRAQGFLLAEPSHPDGVDHILAVGPDPGLW